MRDKNFDVDLLKTLNDQPMPETPLTDDEFTRVLDAACISIFCPRCVNDTKRTPCASAKSRKAFALAYSGVKCMGTKI